MNEQIIKERRRTPWLILAGGLMVVLMVGVGLLLPRWLPQPAFTQQTPNSTSMSQEPTPVILQQSAPSADSNSELAVGQPAPDFTLKTLDGGEASLSKFRGRPVLINFWASWCPPCRLEMPDLVRAYEAHQDDGFVILAINLTFQDSLQEAQRFADEFNMSFPVLLDETGEVTTALYRLYGLPTSVFVDRNGMISHIQIGPMTGAQIDEWVGEILKE
jgi:peroxiredoxin